MKKIVWIVILMVLVVGAGLGFKFWYGRSAAGATTQPTQTAEVTKGDIRTTVDATGSVVSNQDVDIKCKASGEVLQLPFEVSSIVHKGDVLIVVDPADAQRALKQAQANYSSADANLSIAKQNVLIAEQDLVTARQRANAAMMSAVASNHDAQAKLVRVKDLFSRKLDSQEDLDTASAAAAQAQANLESAQAQIDDLKSQELQLDVKKKDVTLSEAAVTNASISVENAQQGLDDTTVRAPIDGVVSAVNIQVGSIISSGITNVGGGTSAMTLSDMSHVYVMATVDESLIGKLITADEQKNAARLISGARRGGASGGWNGNGSWGASATQPGAGTEHANWSGQHRTSQAATEPTEPVRTTSNGAAATDPAGDPPATSASGGPAAAQPAATGPALTTLNGFNFTPRPLPVDITADAYQGVNFHGKVVQIATTGVNTSNVVTFQVKIEVTSPNRVLLRPQMTANVKIITEERDNVLKVPTTAIQHKPHAAPYVTVMIGDKTEDRPVKLGITDDDSYEIVSGVNEGDKVVLHKNDIASIWTGGGRGGWRGPR